MAKQLSPGPRGIARVFRLLEIFADADRPLSLSDVQRQMKMPASSCHVMLQEMVRLGYLRAAEGRRYSVASEMIVLGARIRSTSDLITAASGILEATQIETGETVYLGMAGKNELIFIAASEAKVGLVSRIPTGSRRPLHSSSSGHVYLAFGIEESKIDSVIGREPYKANTPWTITRRSALLKEISKTRKQGYAVVSQATIVGAFGVSAPIFYATGELAGTLSTSAPTSHYDGNYKSLIKAVVASAHEISARLSYRPSSGSGSKKS